ncbi:TetR/AcrR family transcriptional regulator [Mycobacterium shinjukuense]|uniref:TetR/AcrR family transcriptional regulator n=1 Tax=Mycobacterium shinjukuense TaxID=398694 RepID=UPI0009F6A407|nr:TetR/AcrR family transcriptional regulator [Mycobacterium shinjukuense]MCV6986255.1 TetR/AcrR family transcriptional regulator [Mycobacterium shinjukuense]ORB72367.1 TetR family transcriptional regulator [Mycobacterium shinjukuense]
MPRTIPADRFSAIVAASARVFITHGYQRTQVQDVADALALAKGTLYGYAQGKAALFAAAVRYGDAHEPLPPPSDLPVAAPHDGEIAALVSDRLAGEVADMRLTLALHEALPPDTTPASARAELAGIVTDLYRRLARHRIALKLVDRCAPELPDLAQVWFGTGRDVQVNAVQTYLLRRQRAGQLRLPGPAPVVARTIVELCALWAVHRHFDPWPEPASTARPGENDDAVAATLAEFVVRATATADVN